MKILQATVTLGVLVIFLGGCEKTPEPVASVKIEPTQIHLPYPGSVTIEMDWEMQASLDDISTPPLVFVHLLDDEGSVERTFDHVLPFAWQPGTSESYELTLYQSALAPPMDPGIYRLSVGLYEVGGQRWSLSGSGEEVAKLEYLLATVDTQSDPSAVPMFYFSPSWLPLEAGTDVQVLGRRWLTDEGVIRVAEVPAAGRVGLWMEISEAIAQVEEMSLLEGETEPRIDITSTCGGQEDSVAGYGVHEIQVTVLATEDGSLPEECEIVLRPNYQVVEVATLARRSVGLQILTWSND